MRFTRALSRTAVRLLAGGIIVAVVIGVGVVRGRHRTSRPGNAHGRRSRSPWRSSGRPQGASFVDGVTLAFEELNASGGRARGEDAGSPSWTKSGTRTRWTWRGASSRATASWPCSGTSSQASAVPASLVYEKHGVLFLAATATAPRLTHHGFRSVFRLTPDDSVIAEAHAAFARQRGFKRSPCSLPAPKEGTPAGAQLIAHMRDAGVRVAFIRSYLPRGDGEHIDFRPLIAEMHQCEIDAVIIADQLPRAAHLIVGPAQDGIPRADPRLRQARRRSTCGRSAAAPHRTCMSRARPIPPRRHRPTSPSASASRPVEQKTPSIATQGYDALQLLTEAMVASQAVDPLIVATTLRTRKWRGLFGDYSFDWNGNIKGRRVFIKRMDARAIRHGEATARRWRSDFLADSRGVVGQPADRERGPEPEVRILGLLLRVAAAHAGDRAAAADRGDPVEGPAAGVQRAAVRN